MQARQPPNVPLLNVVARSISGTQSCSYSTNVKIMIIIKYFASGLNSYTVGFGKAVFFMHRQAKAILLICLFSFFLL